MNEVTVDSCCFLVAIKHGNWKLDLPARWFLTMEVIVLNMLVYLHTVLMNKQLSILPRVHSHMHKFQCTASNSN